MTSMLGKLLLIAVSLLLTVSFLHAAESPRLGIGNHVPSFSAIDLAGSRIDFRWPVAGDGATLFFFFDIDTAEGLFGMTALERFYREAHDFGLNVLAVECGPPGGERIADALRKYRSVYPSPPYPIVRDGEGSLRRLFGVGSLPSSYLVERHGVILDHGRRRDEREWNALAARVSDFLHLPPGVLATGEAAAQAVPRGGKPEAQRALLFPGDKVPPFEVVDLAGRRHSFSWAPGEKELVVLFFWTDPCRPCLREMLFLDQVDRRARDVGLPVRILAVASGGLDAGRTREAMERVGRVYPLPSLPLVVDEDSRLADVFGWGTLPATYLLDGEGKVVFRQEGFEAEQTSGWIDLLERETPGAQGVLRPALSP